LYYQYIYFYLFTAIIVVFVILPIILEDRVRVDMSVLMNSLSEESIKFRKFIYSNEKLIKIMKYLLPKLDQRGLLDCC